MVSSERCTIDISLSNMKPSELKMPFSVESYDEKTAESYLNCYVNTFQEISRQKALRSGRFIILNDSASSKMVIQFQINVFKCFKAV